LFAGAGSHSPDFLFQRLIEEDQKLTKVFISTRYWTRFTTMTFYFPLVCGTNEEIKKKEEKTKNV